jgi:hypothetical protein
MTMAKTQHIKVPQWIEGRSLAGPFVVRVMVDAIVPEEDPSEPCFEPAALRLIDEAQRLADRGDVDALARLGDVYIRRSA